MGDEHRWIGFDGSWHCYGCGDTRHQTEAPPVEGCLPLRDRAQAVIETPTRWSRTYIADLIRELSDRLFAR